MPGIMTRSHLSCASLRSPIKEAAMIDLGP
nr:MAG TPA: hypothetical protein [Caudoviricetes sp.]